MSIAVAKRQGLAAAGVSVGRRDVVQSGTERAGSAVMETAALLAVIVAIPFAILLIGLPFVLILQLVLRLTRLA